MTQKKGIATMELIEPAKFIEAMQEILTRRGVGIGTLAFKISQATGEQQKTVDQRIRRAITNPNQLKVALAVLISEALGMGVDLELGTELEISETPSS